MKKRSTTYRLNKVDYAIFIIFSIAAALMLFLFYRDLNAFTIKQAEEPVAKIYFKRNTAQRKFVDNDIWEVLTNSSDIYDGDRIRTSKNSEAYTEFTDSGIQIQLREKSMVQIFKNKKERSVNFIGGEIFIANNSAEEKLVVRSGKKEIAVSKESEVKLALPEVSEAAAAGEEEAEESSVVVEVVSGQVEVIDEAEPIVVSAGESITLVPEVEKVTEPQKPAAEPVVEAVAAEEPVLEPVAEAASIEEPVLKVEESIVPVKEEPKEIPVQVVMPGIKKTVKSMTARFKKSVYDQETGAYNYAYGFCIAEALGSNVSVPEGSVLEVTFKGTSDHDIKRFAMQISTGEDPWKRAHSYKDTIPNNGEGIIKGKAFEATHKVIIDYPIINSDKSWVDISYDPRVLDEPSAISDFEIFVKVVSNSGGLNIKKISKGYTKTLEYKNLSFFKDVWGDGPKDFDYRVSIDANDFFDQVVSIPAGSKIKISVSGTCDQPIPWCYPELIFTDEQWVRVLLDKDDYDVWANLRFSESDIKKNEAFSYSKVYTVKQDFPNTNQGLFQFTVYHEGMNGIPVFSDLKLSIEVVE